MFMLMLVYRLIIVLLICYTVILPIFLNTFHIIYRINVCTTICRTKRLQGLRVSNQAHYAERLESEIYLQEWTEWQWKRLMKPIRTT